MHHEAETAPAKRRVAVPRFKKGLDLPIAGQPVQEIEIGPSVRSCAVLGGDYLGLKPQMAVGEGDRVQAGQALFRDKRFTDVAYTAPAPGVVRAINRGPRRVLESVVIDIDDTAGSVDFGAHEAEQIAAIGRQEILDTLCRSGLWTALRARPFGKIPDPSSTPAALFVTAMDTAPLAADPVVVIATAPDDFRTGVQLLSRLTDGNTYVCQAAGARIPEVDGERVVTASFEGPHPAGLPGTHIHVLEPVDAGRVVWHIDYQDAMAVGTLFRTGFLPSERVIALCGPAARAPRLLRVKPGASVAELIEGEAAAGPIRPISGDVLTGHTARDHFGYLGRYHRQVTLMHDASPRELLGWLLPFRSKFTTARVHLRNLFGLREPLAMNTSLHGSARAMVPVGLYEDMVPLDMLPTQLLRSVLVMDTDMAQSLGVLELIEEDVALCTFICHSKYEYGMALRACLDKIEAEG